jgi:hypothetical protein
VRNQIRKAESSDQDQQQPLRLVRGIRFFAGEGGPGLADAQCRARSR